MASSGTKRSGAGDAAATGGVIGRLRIRGRVLLVVAFAAVLTGAVGGIGCWQISRVTDRGDAVYTDALLPLQDLSALREAVGRARIDGLSRVMAAGNQAAAQEYTRALGDDEKAIDAMHAAYAARHLTAEQRTALDTFWTAWTDYRDARTAADELAAQHRMSEFQQVRDERMTPDTKTALGALNDLSRMSAVVAAQERDSADRAGRTALVLVLVVAALGLVVAAGIGSGVAASIVRPLHRLRDVLTAVGDGDLTGSVSAPGRDEVGDMARALARAVDRIHAVLTAASDSCLALGPRAQELHEASRNLARTAEHTSAEVARIDEAAAGVAMGIDSVSGGATVMGASIQEIAANAQQAANVAGEAVAAAATTDKIMSDLGSSSSEIGNVINLINAIAEQTNLLALNATIEAARAGEAGKGFAVVASEVKDLAHETATATKDISGRVEAIQADTGQAARSILGVTSVIKQIDALQTAIASAVEEQSVTTRGMGDALAGAARDASRISAGIEAVVTGARTTQQDAEAVEQAAAQLTAVSTQLAAAISGFRV